MLTDGVMVLQNVESDQGILLLNESLKKLFEQATVSHNSIRKMSTKKMS